MAVIINDFEVLVEQPSPNNSQNSTADQPSQNVSSQPVLRPRDIERIIRYFDTRRMRLRAD